LPEQLRHVADPRDPDLVDRIHSIAEEIVLEVDHLAAHARHLGEQRVADDRPGRQRPALDLDHAGPHRVHDEVVPHQVRNHQALAVPHHLVIDDLEGPYPLEHLGPEPDVAAQRKPTLVRVLAQHPAPVEVGAHVSQRFLPCLGELQAGLRRRHPRRRRAVGGPCSF
jgi:hypothetical protein